jgi:hypothetical protein
MSNKTINTLAETMNTESFINELETRNIDFEFDNVDNVCNYNDGLVNLIVNDVAYLFADGELNSVSYKLWHNTNRIFILTKK